MEESKNSGKITINDVARAAGVSKGTVDRVLHARGEVSKKSREKVLKVIEELGFKPNMYASLLATRKEYVIQCLIPEYFTGEFWSFTDKGIQDAAELVARYGIKVESVKYDQYNLESFQGACARILANPPSGLLVAPMFRAQTLQFVKELSEKRVPYMFIDSKIEDENYLAYFGMPMYQSGYLCADILTNERKVDKVYMVRIARDKRGLSDPTVTRRTGFLDYMSEHYPNTQLENVFINPINRDEMDRVLDNVIGSDNDFKYIVMFNSRVHLVADWISRRGIRDCRVVGYDVLDKNLAALRAGTVNLLIAQHTDKRTVEAISAMADFLILNKPVPQKDNFTQMDILNRYNCDYYL
ncbi:MAG: LacI family transcriptional regulator [Bacteroidales bacterium]|nr:LacI family transcriptional regulator [Bacteroidales bacterium]